MTERSKLVWSFSFVTSVSKIVGIADSKTNDGFTVKKLAADCNQPEHPTQQVSLHIMIRKYIDLLPTLRCP